MTNKLELPIESYIFSFQGTDFVVEPVSEKCLQLLTEISSQGGKVRLMPETNPTSVFVHFKQLSPPVYQMGLKVMGIEMDLHLNLLSDHNKFDKKLKNFLEDMTNNCFPKNHSSDGSKSLQIVRTFNY